MAVRTYTRRDGATVYCALFRGPNGEQLVRKVRVVPAAARKKAHERARTAAAKASYDNRALVENGEWGDDR